MKATYSEVELGRLRDDFVLVDELDPEIKLLL